MIPQKESNDTQKKTQMDFFGSAAGRNFATLINTTERGHAPKAQPEKPLKKSRGNF